MVNKDFRYSHPRLRFSVTTLLTLQVIIIIIIIIIPKSTNSIQLNNALELWGSREITKKN